MKKALVILAILLIPVGARAQGFEQDILLLKIIAQDILIYGSTSATAGNTSAISATADKNLLLATQLAQAISTSRYQGLKGLLWEAPYLLSADRYGRATPWTQAAIGLSPAAGAYGIATVPVPTGDWPAYYASATPAQQQRIGSEYAWLQDTDAENAAALASIGDSNYSIPTGQVALSNLVNDNFAMGFAATNPQLSQIAIAQKQSIGTTMGVQVEVQNQQLLAHILHQLILMNTRSRNDEAAKLNSDQLVHEQAATAQQGVQGLSSALASFHF